MGHQQRNGNFAFDILAVCKFAIMADQGVGDFCKVRQGKYQSKVVFEILVSGIFEKVQSDFSTHVGAKMA